MIRARGWCHEPLLFRDRGGRPGGGPDGGATARLRGGRVPGAGRARGAARLRRGGCGAGAAAGRARDRLRSGRRGRRRWWCRSSTRSTGSGARCASSAKRWPPSPARSASGSGVGWRRAGGPERRRAMWRLVSALAVAVAAGAMVVAAQDQRRTGAAARGRRPPDTPPPTPRCTKRWRSSTPAIRTSISPAR